MLTPDTAWQDLEHTLLTLEDTQLTEMCLKVRIIPIIT